MAENESFDLSKTLSVVRSTGRTAMGTVRFLYLIAGTCFFGIFAFLGFLGLKNATKTEKGEPYLSWKAEPFSTGGSTPIVAFDKALGREEGWLFGGPNTGKVFAGLFLWQKPDGSPAVAPAFLGASQILSRQPMRTGGLANAPRYEMTTRWGKFNGLDFQFVESDGKLRSCIYFNSMFDTHEFSIYGFYCASGRTSAAAGPLSCLIDRIGIKGGETKNAAAAYLAARAGQGATCSHRTFYPVGTSGYAVRNRNGGIIGYQ